jgi:hypothetical protein
MGKPVTKAKKKKAKLSKKEQSARFIEMAQTLDADESGEKFERVFEKIVPVKARATRSTS